MQAVKFNSQKLLGFRMVFNGAQIGAKLGGKLGNKGGAKQGRKGGGGRDR